MAWASSTEVSTSPSGAPVAIKALAPDLTRQPEFRERFFSEAKTQARLQHPNIVAVYDLLEDEGEYFIVMELVTGVPLDDRLQEAAGRGMDVGEAAAVASQMLSALDYAHSEGVIHRDIKPSNVLIATGGRVKIMDFGIALLIGDKRLTASQSSIGTPSYMSPEQILRPREVDHRTDIYSAGVVLYEMLAGRPPFDDDTEYGIKKLHVETPPPDLHALRPELPAALIQAISVALAKAPDDRFASAGLFLRAISEAAPAPAGTATAPLVPMPPRPTVLDSARPSPPSSAGTSAGTSAAGWLASLGGSMTSGRGRWIALAVAAVIVLGLAGLLAVTLGGHDEVAAVAAEDGIEPAASDALAAERGLDAPAVPMPVAGVDPDDGGSEVEPANLAAVQPPERTAPSSLRNDPPPVSAPTPPPSTRQAKPPTPRPQANREPKPVPRAQDTVEEPPAPEPEAVVPEPVQDEPEKADSAADSSLDEFAEMDDLIVSIERLSNQTLDAYEAEGRDDRLLEQLDQFVEAAGETRKEFRKVTGTGFAGLKANVRGILRRNRGGQEADRRVLELKVENLARRAAELDGLVASSSPGTLTVELWQELRRNVKKLEGYF